MGDLSDKYMTGAEAARILGVDSDTVGRLVRQGHIPAEKMGKTWIISRSFIVEMAKSYQGRRGRPRKKRKYTRRM